MKHDLDALLRGALSSDELPDSRLIQQVKHRLRQEGPSTQRSKKTSFPVRIIIIAAAAVLLCTAALAAGVLLLRPGEAAREFDDQALSAVFDSESAVNINETVTSGGYIFTLLAVVSGTDLSDWGEVQADRTYAVLAIQKEDGMPMPTPPDEGYRDANFLATPLIKGQAPWLVNIAVLHGNGSQTVVDGVMYRLIECDSVAMFADRGLYLGVCDGIIPSSSIFLFDEATGEISVNPDYDGVSVIFDLPLDESLADPERAEEYLAEMFGTPDMDETSADANAGADAVSNEEYWEFWDQAVPIDSTFRELTVDQDGYLHYSVDYEFPSGPLTLWSGWFDQYGQTTCYPMRTWLNDTAFAVRFDKTETGYTAVVVVAPDS